MKPELLYTMVCEFKGKSYPDIPLPFDRTELPEEAFFATLPIGRVGAESRNNRKYSRKAVESIVAFVNQEHPRGWWGHPDYEARTLSAPVIQWLGAVIDDEGIAWGKCLALSSEARDLLRMAKLTRSKIGTSVYGNAEMNGTVVEDMQLMYIDLLTEGEWVGVPETSTVPILTAESNQAKGETNMPEANELAMQLVAITQERDTAKQALAAAQQTITEMEALRPAAAQFDAIRAKITESADVYTRLEINISGYGSDLASVINDTIDKLKSLLADKMMAQIEGAVEEKVKIPDLRPIVLGMVKKDIQTEADIAPKIDAAMALPHIQALAAKLVAQEAGPSAVASAMPPVPKNEAATKEAVDKAYENAQRMGLLPVR